MKLKSTKVTEYKTLKSQPSGRSTPTDQLVDQPTIEDMQCEVEVDYTDKEVKRLEERSNSKSDWARNCSNQLAEDALKADLKK